MGTVSRHHFSETATWLEMRDREQGGWVAVRGRRTVWGAPVAPACLDRQAGPWGAGGKTADLVYLQQHVATEHLLGS